MGGSRIMQKRAGFMSTTVYHFVGIVCILCFLGGCEQALKVTITSPQNRDSFSWGEQVTFSGSAVDAEGNVPAGLQLTWSSDRDGTIGSGAVCICSDLSVGKHRITLTAVDDEGNIGTDTVKITILQRTGLIIRDSDFVGRDYRDTMWASVTVTDSEGTLITGLSLDDFELTEAVIQKSDGSVKAEEEIDISQFFDDEWSEAGFWEASRGGEPIDIVIAYDNTGTMSDYVKDAKDELIAMVGDLKANHVDFRIAALGFDETGIDQKFGFYGPQEADRLLYDIEYWLSRGGGDWWDPGFAYDAVLYTPWFGFREEARKVCVVLSDLVPQTVYGTFWYAGGCTAATASAVEIFLQQTGVELYYCQRTGYDPVDYDYYMDSGINPRAGDNESGFVSLKADDGTPLAVELSWPFSRHDFMETLGIDEPQPVTDSLYLLAWESSIDRWDAVEDNALVYAPDDYELRLSVRTPDPDNAGSYLTASCTYPIEKVWNTTKIYLRVTDEEGTPYNSDLWGYVYHMMGERKITQAGQLSPRDGTIEVTYLPLDSTYHIFICDGGVWSYDYPSIRAVYRETIRVTEDGASYDMQVETADKTAELCKARGLLRDIGDWQGIGDPFQDMVDEAGGWLDDLEADGVSWRDIVKVKSFYVALSGYANVVYYSQQEAEGAIKDFTAIVQNFRDIVKQVEKIQEDTAEDWARELAAILIAIVDFFATHGEATLQKELLDEALDHLLDYATEKLTVDLREKIIEQFPLGDYSELLTTIVNYLIDAAFGGESSEPDWDGVFESIKAITLDKAIDTVKKQAGGAIIDAALDRALQGAIGDDALTRNVKGLVKDSIDALLSDNMEKEFQNAFEGFADGMKDYVFSHDNETIVAAVNRVFDTVDDELKDAGAPVDIREFLVGMARDLTLCAIPALENGTVNFRLDTDALVSILIKYGVYYVILKDYFIDEIAGGLDDVLYAAQNTVPVGDDRDDWDRYMSRAFWDYRQVVDGVQDKAWGAIRGQEAITEWALEMQELCDTLDAISAPLDFFAYLWPDLEDTAEDVHTFIGILDGFQILANAVSFGLKVDCLDTFGNTAGPLYQTAFPQE